VCLRNWILTGLIYNRFQNKSFKLENGFHWEHLKKNGGDVGSRLKPVRTGHKQDKMQLIALICRPR
jgi:hypothetical protein